MCFRDIFFVHFRELWVTDKRNSEVTCGSTTLVWKGWESEAFASEERLWVAGSGKSVAKSFNLCIRKKKGNKGRDSVMPSKYCLVYHELFSKLSWFFF